jgi:hypothetical protein
LTSNEFSVAPAPEIIYVNRPTIKFYFVTDEKLDAVKMAIANVSQDFGFMTTSLGVFVTALFALIPIYGSSQSYTPSFWLFTIVAGLAAITMLYTFPRWYRLRNQPKEIIDKIRSPQT